MTGTLCLRLLVRLAILFFVGLCLVVQPRTVHAETITVDTTSDFDVDDGDNNCTLPEAILAANYNAPQDNCPAGDHTPTDTIVLEADTIFSIPRSYLKKVMDMV